MLEEGVSIFECGDHLLFAGPLTFTACGGGCVLQCVLVRLIGLHSRAKLLGEPPRNTVAIFEERAELLVEVLKDRAEPVEFGLGSGARPP